ncbi:thiocillin family RiPP [Nonomuraea sp. NBC_00507]|uniref:thiocillin family RiPP n=1 Tax=Nonomuraea sp. NBC_00507 TaxID=2976002 RepID=UPI002E18E93E
MTHHEDLDLSAVQLPDDGLELEQFREGVALATLSTTSTLGTASCPSTAGSVMTAMCYGP